MEGLAIQFQKTKSVLNKITSNRTTSSKKQSKTKDRDKLIKAIREKKYLKYKGKNIKITKDFFI